MTSDTLDPLIHVPARLRIVATLAALPDGDALSFTRLQDMIGLTPGNLITHLRKLEDAGYLTTEKTGNGPASRTSVALTHRGRAHSTPTPTRSAACSTGYRRRPHPEAALNDVKPSLNGRATLSVVLRLSQPACWLNACGGTSRVACDVPGART